MIKISELFFLTFVVGLVSVFGLIAEEPLSEAEDIIDDVIESLDWKYEGTYHLSLSNSTLPIPDGSIALIGEDARKFYEVMECARDNQLEAFVAFNDFQSSVYISCFNDGHVSLSYWDSVDSSALLKAIQEDAEKVNAEKRSKGLPTLKILGWIQEPVLDRNANTVLMSIECLQEETGKNVINSIALKLSKKGFEKIICVTDKDYYMAFGSDLDVILQSHSFAPGYRYSDFSKGDKVASYGIASLVAATVGGQIVKSSAIIVGLKKLWIPLFAAVAALLHKAISWFRRSSNDNQS